MTRESETQDTWLPDQALTVPFLVTLDTSFSASEPHLLFLVIKMSFLQFLMTV